MCKGEKEHVGCALPSTTLTVRDSSGTPQGFFFGLAPDKNAATFLFIW
jgi:hypothetical protein